MRRRTAVTPRKAWVLRPEWRWAEELNAGAVGKLLSEIAYDPMDPLWPPAGATGSVTLYGPNPRRPAFAAILKFKDGTITEVTTS